MCRVWRSPRLVKLKVQLKMSFKTATTVQCLLWLKITASELMLLCLSRKAMPKSWWAFLLIKVPCLSPSQMLKGNLPQCWLPKANVSISNLSRNISTETKCNLWDWSRTEAEAEKEKIPHIRVDQDQWSLGIQTKKSQLVQSKNTVWFLSN